MPYTVVVTCPDGTVTHAGITKIRAQNVMESYLHDGVEFALTVSPYIHGHEWKWAAATRDGMAFQCGCGETFQLSQTILDACFAGELEARKHGAA